MSSLLIPLKYHLAKPLIIFTLTSLLRLGLSWTNLLVHNLRAKLSARLKAASISIERILRTSKNCTYINRYYQQNQSSSTVQGERNAPPTASFVHSLLKGNQKVGVPMERRSGGVQC